MTKYKYSRTVLFEHGGMEGVVRERAVKDRQVIHTLERNVKEGV